jgi:hypothetical protein
MTYYLSAFCTDGEIPSPGQVQTWATGRTPPITIDPDEPPNCRWHSINIYYGLDDRAFPVDIYGPGDPPEYDWLDVLPGTIEDFRTALETLPRHRDATGSWRTWRAPGSWSPSACR